MNTFPGELYATCGQKAAPTVSCQCGPGALHHVGDQPGQQETLTALLTFREAEHACNSSAASRKTGFQTELTSAE